MVDFCKYELIEQLHFGREIINGITGNHSLWIFFLALLYNLIRCFGAVASP